MLETIKNEDLYFYGFSDSEGRTFESHRAYQSWKKLFPFGEVSSNPYMTYFLNFAIRMSL